MTRRDAGPAYDPLDLATHGDPYPAYRRLRAEAPLYRNEQRRFWALSRHDDVVRAAQDWRTFASAREGERSALDLAFGIRQVDYVAADNERHLVVRRLLQPAFAPRALARLEPVVRELAAGLVAPLAAACEADFVAELAQPLPALVLCELLGLPAGDADAIRRWNRDLWDRRPGDITLTENVFAAEREAYERVRAAVAGAPGGLLGTLCAARDRGELRDAELLDVGVLLIAAGVKTSAALIGNSSKLLAEHPEAQDALAAAPALVPGAIEEVLRFDSPTQWFTRVTTAAVETAYGTIPAGERVLLLFGSANRDERRHDAPDRFDVRRAARHLSFGHGIHHCVGAALARLEARVCVEVVLARLGDLRPAGAVRRTYTPAERDLASLPLAYSPRPATETVCTRW